VVRASLKILVITALVVSAASRAQDEQFDVSIPAQPLGGALQTLAAQIDVQIVFFSGATRGLDTEGLEGSFTRLQALDAILADTGLRYVFLNDNSVAIQPVPEAEGPDLKAARPEAAATPPGPGNLASHLKGPTPTEAYGMEEVVVTGTASRGRTKYESSVGISTFDRAEIERRAPASTADLISAVPGFWVESTAGATHGNVFARGIVQDGGYRYVGLVEDGLPVYPVFELSFYNPDQFIRLSESVARVEAVRGGTAPIFTSGAVGGAINFVNDDSTGSGLRLKASLSEFDNHAVDAHWSAALGEAWQLSAGGYARESGGIRDPGYPADRGGQLRVDLRRITPDSELGVYAKYLDDRSLFVVPVPLRGSPANPVAVDGSAAGEYSLHSEDIRAAGLPPSAREVGLTNDDLADGIHPSVLTAGFRLDHEWHSGLSLTTHSRLTDGDVSFNAIFTGDVPVTGSELAAERGVEPDFTYISSGEVFDPDFLVQNHGHWAVYKDYRALQNDTRLNLPLERHDVTVGAYFADFSMSDRWSLGNLLLTDVRSRPRRLFLPGATDEQGFTRYSFLNLAADYDGRLAAAYLSDEWALNDRLRVDLGLRYDSETIDASISDGTGEVDLDGDPATRYDRAMLAGPDRTRTSHDFSHASWSLGFNYDFSDRHAAFGHYTRSAKLPHFDDVRNGATDKDRVTNAELGYKTSLDELALFLTAYRTEFDNVPFSDVLVDGSIVLRRARTRTWGVELEGVYEPVDSVAVQFSVTLQDPEYRNFSGTAVDNSGNRVRRIPRTMVRMVPSVDFADGRGRLFLSFSHYGKRFANDENTIELPDYIKLDAGLQYAFNAAWSAQLNVDNLSDEAGLTEGNPRTDVGASGLGQLYNARTLFGRSLSFAVRYKFQSG
jgi:iron complex outermembrane recepter protein